MPNGDHLLLQHAHNLLNHARSAKGDNTAVIDGFNRVVNQYASGKPDMRAFVLRHLHTSEEDLQVLLTKGYLAEAANLLDKARKTHDATDYAITHMREYLNKANAGYAAIGTTADEVLRLLRKGYRNGAHKTARYVLIQWEHRPERLTQTDLDTLDFYHSLSCLSLAKLGLDEATLQTIRDKVAHNAA